MRGPNRLAARLGRCRRGMAAVEFALVAPVLLLLTGGIVEFGAGFSAYKTANRLASQYAIAWADCKDTPVGTCQTELTTLADTYAVANIVPQLKAGQLTLRMFQVKMVGTSPTVVYAHPSGATLTSAEQSASQAAFPADQSGVLISVTYAHSLQYFSALMGPYLNSRLTASYRITQLKS